MQWYELLIIFGLALVTLYLLKRVVESVYSLYISAQGPFFAPTSDDRMKQLLKLAQPILKKKPNLTVVDLGSGDARILIEIAKRYPVTAIGYEIDPKLVKQSRKLIQQAHLKGKVTIHQSSFWDADVSQADLVCCYCIQRCMPKLEEKLQKELKPSAEVVSVFFRFPRWLPVRSEDDVHLHRQSELAHPTSHSSGHH